jgi:hypothetical protein
MPRCGRKMFMKNIANNYGWEFEIGGGLPPIFVRRSDIRILCASSIQDEYGPGGWSYLIGGLSLQPIRQSGKQVAAPLIQLHACVKARVNSPGVRPFSRLVRRSRFLRIPITSLRVPVIRRRVSGIALVSRRNRLIALGGNSASCRHTTGTRAYASS